MANRNDGYRQTYDTNVSNNPLVVLRKVDFEKMDEATIGLLAQTQIAFRTPEASLAWFRDGYILNDHPRSAGLTSEIMLATLGFAVGRTDREEVMDGTDGLSLKSAEKAVKGAEIRLDLAIDIPDSEEDAGSKPLPKGPKGSKVAAAIAAVEASRAELAGAEANGVFAQ